MKVLPFEIPKPNNDALIYQEDYELVFYDKLHQHNEIQISFLEKGNGTLFIGDSVSNYITGEIFIIGSNVPHAFKSEKNVTEKSKMLSLFFTRDSFGTQFFDLKEFESLQSFFEKSKFGFKVLSHQNEIINLFLQLKKASKIDRFIRLIELLKIIAQAEKQSLSNFVYQKKLTDNEGKKMRAVFEFTTNNAHQEIELKDVANIANMTKNAFCKYFKKRTNKTYFSFLTELRIENSCRLLRSQKEYSVAEIAHLSGFQNISNFNRKFKELKKTTPLKYRNL